MSIALYKYGASFVRSEKHDKQVEHPLIYGLFYTDLYEFVLLPAIKIFGKSEFAEEIILMKHMNIAMEYSNRHIRANTMKEEMNNANRRKLGPIEPLKGVRNLLTQLARFI